MKAKFDDTYLILEPEDQFERAKISALPWVLASPSGPFCYWTRIVDLSKIVKLKMEPDDLVRLSAAARTKPNLAHLNAADYAEFSTYFTPKYPPRSYQLTGIAHLLAKDHAILADETGTGKTLIAMGAVMVKEFREPSDGSIVIVTPSGIRHQWRSEIMKMFRNPHTANEQALHEDLIQVFDGPPAVRAAILKLEPRKIFIVGYDLLIRDAVEIFKHLEKRGISALILDESSRIKNAETKTAQTVAALVRQFKPRQLYCLNATPIENNLGDLWPQLYVVQPTIFPSWKDFDSTYIRRISLKIRSGVKVSKVVGHQNVDHLRALVKDRYIRRRYSDVEGDLPEIVVSHHFVDLGSTQRKLYNIVKNDPKKNALERVNALVRAALFCKDDDGKMHSAKLDELPALVEELGDERCVFVSQSKVFALEVRKLLLDFGNTGLITGDVQDEDRTAIVRDFTGGAIKYLVGTEAIERGLNLQAAGWLINLDLPWTAASWFQRVGRVRRIGSKHATVRIINMIANDSAEAYVFKTVYQKHDLFTRLFGATDVEPVSVAEIARAI